ncbi:MAG: outer membrane protein assembly factor [Chitinophagales bacterium]|nr:outer membrane protein assembly factor [Chitinophagales bacterium]
MIRIPVLILLLMAVLFRQATAQVNQHSADSLVVDYANPKSYVIGGIEVRGTQYLDKDILAALAGIRKGDRIDIPGTEISKAVKNLWKQDLFANVRIYVERTVSDTAFLTYELDERPRLSGFTFRGTTKGEQDDLREKIKLNKGKVLTDNIKVNTYNTIKSFYNEKGFTHVKVTISEVPDSSQQNSMLYYIYIDKGNRVRIDNIWFKGNTAVSSRKLRGLMKKTKENPVWSVFTVSKFRPSDYEDDKGKVLAYYATKGYRDAHIKFDTVYENENGNLNIQIWIAEGNKYYFRDIRWSGNSKYASSRLDSALHIKKGDVYDEEFLQKRLNGDPNGTDVGSLYMDDGYLFFSVTPVEVSIENDSIDLEIRVHEGPQATINRVFIEGNTKTHEHVIRRVIRTTPGSKFSRADVIRTQREILATGFFDPEKLGINTDPHPENGTVDLTYSVEEKPSDQVELSAGWGGSGTGVIGSLGVKFNNFSMRNLFDTKTWSPLPSGDGQVFSVRLQSNGRYYQSFNIGFTEPWLGGKKPNSLNIGLYSSRYARGTSRDDPAYGTLVTTGATVGLGKQLQWPDDFFTLISAVNFTNYSLDNYTTNFFINTGNAYSISLKETFGRNSTGPDFTFPKWGSNFYISLALTPPYSLFNDKDYTDLPIAEKYKWVEFHKWRFGAEWYTNVFGKFVLKTAAKGGYLGYYNPEIGLTPFERFDVGGDGLSQNYSLYGVDIISQRGYKEVYATAAPIFNKFTLELRYPFSTSPSAFIYGTAWVEAGNAWYSFDDYDPFNLRRAAGLGLRVFLPIFGTVGFDYGIGFDKPRPLVAPRTLGEYLSVYGAFNIVLGFEPE